jgi:antirestriction protein ArdC
MSAVTARESKEAKLATMRQQVMQLAQRMVDPDFGDETFRTYLQFLARFHQYSFTNVCLILMQCPQARWVAGFRRWLELGRYVRKGERGIAIFVPFVGKKKEVEQDDQGEAEGEAAGVVAARAPRPVHFGVGYVFDVSQTDGEGEIYPAFRLDLGEGVAPRHEALVEFAASEGIELKDGTRWQNGVNETILGSSAGGTIHMNEAAPVGSQVQTLVHELAHEFLHQQDRDGTTRPLREGEAEAVTCVVMQHLGFDTSAYNADYIRSHGCSAEQIVKSMDRIAVCARRIVEGLIEHSR